MLALHLRRVIITVKIMTTYMGCEYITPRKHYQVIGEGPYGCLEIINDYGVEISVRVNTQSAHLDYKGMFTEAKESLPSTIAERRKTLIKVACIAAALMTYTTSIVAATVSVMNYRYEHQVNSRVGTASD